MTQNVNAGFLNQHCRIISRTFYKMFLIDAIKLYQEKKLKTFFFYATVQGQRFVSLKNMFFCLMCQIGSTLDHDFYVVVGKQCRTENAKVGHQHNIFI